MKYSILSRGKHADYRWNEPSEEATELFSICRDEEGPIIVLKVAGDGDKAALLLGGICSLIRRDRTNSTIRDAIYFRFFGNFNAGILSFYAREDGTGCTACPHH